MQEVLQVTSIILSFLAISVAVLSIVITNLGQKRSRKFDDLIWWQKKLDDCFCRGSRAFFNNDLDEFDKCYEEYQVLKRRLELEKKNHFDKK